jgi:hypothetical protein
MRDINFLQRKLARLELRLDVLDEMQICLLRVRVVRVAGHGDVTARRLLVERGVEFAPVEQPAFQFAADLICAARFSNWSNSGAICGQSPRLIFSGTNFRGLCAGNFPNGNKFMREG